MNAMKILAIGYMAFLLFFGCVNTGGNSGNESIVSKPSELKKFSSAEELKAFLDSRPSYNYGGELRYMVSDNAMVAKALPAPMAEGSQEYSETNIQVEGVDEADFVKTDGDYIYVISGDKLVIVDAYPADDAELLSEIELGSPMEFFVNGDDLVVFDQRSYDETDICQYDISDRSNPVLENNITVDGYYFNSRMIDGYVYAIINNPVYYDIPKVPLVSTDGEANESFPDVYYFDEPAYSYRFTTVLSIDLDTEDIESKIFLMGTSQDLYVSQDNIYVVYQKAIPTYENPVTRVVTDMIPILPDMTEETAIHRISIDDGKIEYAASGSVPGYVLNQFSMDEYNGYFRIATTTGHVARSAETSDAKNHIYVLDEDLEVVGELEDLAPGEKIYSARFMGERAYLVTFRKVDPLFVIDLGDPEEPSILGKLKIPGYSDYLHPYDENHIIGIGKEAVAADEGDFSWYQGVKVALFDVSDVENPKEISKYEIGDRGTDSYALHDHRAFLFSKSKHLMVIPILLAEINEEQYPAGISPSQYGEYVWQGAYVFDISAENGFQLKGTVSHVEDDSFLKSGYYYSSPYSVKRSLYIGDVLYTISDSKIKMNELDTLDEVAEVDLPYEESGYPVYYE